MQCRPWLRGEISGATAIDIEWDMSGVLATRVAGTPAHAVAAKRGAVWVASRSACLSAEPVRADRGFVLKLPQASSLESLVCGTGSVALGLAISIGNLKPVGARRGVSPSVPERMSVERGLIPLVAAIGVKLLA